MAGLGRSSLSGGLAITAEEFPEKKECFSKVFLPEEMRIPLDFHTHKTHSKFH